MEVLAFTKGRAIPPSIYWGVALIGLFVACFKAWLEEHKTAEALKGEIESARKRPGVTSSQWRELGEKFKSHPHTGAQYQSWSNPKQHEWKITGLHDDTISELCALAGVMLLRSSAVFATLHDEVRAEVDNVDRWLTFLKVHHRAMHLEGSGTEDLGDGRIIFSTNLAASDSPRARPSGGRLLRRQSCSCRVLG